MQQNNTRTQRGKRFNKKRKQGNRPKASLTVMAPRRQRKEFAYSVVFNLTNNGNQTVSRRFYTNGWYDMDPTVGSTAMAGFSEFMAIWNYFRGMSYRYQITLNNQEPITIQYVIFPSNTDPGTAGTAVVSWVGLPHAKSGLLGAVGGQSRATIRGSNTIADIVGQNVGYEDNYRGTSSANPADLTYLAVGLNAINGDFTTAGVAVQWKVNVVGFIYDYKLLTF